MKKPKPKIKDRLRDTWVAKTKWGQKRGIINRRKSDRPFKERKAKDGLTCGVSGFTRRSGTFYGVADSGEMKDRGHLEYKIDGNRQLHTRRKITQQTIKYLGHPEKIIPGEDGHSVATKVITDRRKTDVRTDRRSPKKRKKPIN